VARKEQGSTKRQSIRNQRKQRQRMQRLTLIGGVLLLALLLAGMIIIPNMIAAANVEIVREENRPFEDGREMGEDSAAAVIDVFIDFQCVACRNFSLDIEKRIMEDYVATGQARYVYRQFPFLDDQSPNKYSDRSAMASMCAAEQNRFWDFHDSIFANFGIGYTDTILTAIAEKLELDMGQFRDCFRSNKYQTVINEDIAYGQSLGVSGTPSVFVNGKRVGDNPQMVPGYDLIRAAIEAEINR
jgi:protein-disulfide isomerase